MNSATFEHFFGADPAEGFRPEGAIRIAVTLDLSNPDHVVGTLHGDANDEVLLAFVQDFFRDEHDAWIAECVRTLQPSLTAAQRLAPVRFRWDGKNLNGIEMPKKSF